MTNLIFESLTPVRQQVKQMLLQGTNPAPVYVHLYYRQTGYHREYSCQHMRSFNCCVYSVTAVIANSRRLGECIVNQIFNTIDPVCSPTIQWFTILGPPKPKARACCIRIQNRNSVEWTAIATSWLLKEFPFHRARPGPQDSIVCFKDSLFHLYFLPVWASSGEHEVVVEVILLMREVRVCVNVYHPRSAIATDT